MLGAQASGTKVESLELSVYNDSNRVNIRQPPSISMAFGVTYIMAKLK